MKKSFFDVKVQSSGEVFQFGDGEPKVAKKKICIPTYLDGVNKKLLWVNVVEADIPLLLDEKTMGSFKVTIDFGKKVVFIDGIEQKQLLFTSSGHYCLPIGKRRQVHLADATPHAKTIIVNTNKSVKDTNVESVWLVKDLLVEDMTRAEKLRIAGKLHRQFNHASADRLILVVRDAGIHDEELITLLQDINGSCQTCIKYKRSSPRPAVGLPMAKEFNETLAMDLKELTGRGKKLWFLHIIDLGTRYSAACIVTSKNKERIVGAIFTTWVSVFGRPRKVLVDNGGEFANTSFISFAENFNLRNKTTAGESPWSNGTVERHNGLIGQSIDKICEDTQCSLEIALAWAVSAKNSLSNVYGYSPNQWFLGETQIIPVYLAITLLHWKVNL